MSKTIELAVVGMLYRTNTTQLEKIKTRLPLKCFLVREPKNLNDKNAIAVRLDDQVYPDFKIGYLQRDTAAEFAPRLDEDKIQVTRAELREIDPERGNGEMAITFRRV